MYISNPSQKLNTVTWQELYDNDMTSDVISWRQKMCPNVYAKSTGPILKSHSKPALGRFSRAHTGTRNRLANVGTDSMKHEETLRPLALQESFVNTP